MPSDPREAKRITRESPYYSIVDGHLHKRGFLQPLLKCLDEAKANYALKEVREGCCRHHMGGKSLALKVLRSGYYWPSVIQYAKEFVKRRPPYQQHAHFHVAPPEELNTISFSWPLNQ